MKQLTWKLQENIVDKKNIETLINFIQTTDRYTQFVKVKEFEREWSRWQGCKYSVFVNSGSSANLLIIALLKDIKKWQIGDEVIVPAVTWITDISTVMQLGLKPVFVDVNLDDFSFDYEDLEKKITPKTRAIFLTHLIGFPADIMRIKKIIGNRDIQLVEDCCESHGATIEGEKIGNFGIASSFSTYWGHHMTTVEGGLVSTNDEEVYHYALLKRSHGLARELPVELHDKYKKMYPDINFNFLFLTDGFNLRNTELNAVLGIEQIKKLDSFIEIRNKNYQYFIEMLKQYQNYLLIPYKQGISSFCLPFFLKQQSLRKSLQEYLTDHGIESRPVISGNLLKQPFLKNFSKTGSFPNADFVHNNGFYIGNNQFVNKERINYLATLLEDFFANNK